MRGAEIRKITSRGKSVLVDRTCIGERSRGAVRIIRGTKLPVYRARNPTGDTLAAAGLVHRTVSPAEMLSVSGTNAKPCPTVTSKIWLGADGAMLGTGCPL